MHAALRIAVFALLSINTAIYLVSGSASASLDSIAWLTLLVLFEIETGSFVRPAGIRATPAIRALRLVAAAALAVALAGYARDGEWADVINTGLWFAVVGLLELEVRFPAFFELHRAALAVTAAALYCSLATLVGAWLWRGEWFDAYDAALWLAAFAMLEMDVLGFIGKGRPAA